ncbi:low molecular weight protein-tyrosine-phosphatase [Sphingomonas abietis]|uniref:protein-tyrosine-phosphatase n=1 Tax=Sphingomonas abietis TaxID=3012344 RepID=A0ABY7NSN0_9SPHN|nr:low molecular weight protein-tyrosine-phosphatase [Sphingomonas abietis]WBO24579.1 low molecular weight phosphotyrosine protein phosphatase [Sphingomonas abietis]
MVCLGNICRSPLAEAALRAEAGRLSVDIAVESAGTGGWHVGHPPDRRAQATARRHGIDISGYRGRQVEAADFRHFTHIFALDADNLSDLRRIAPPDALAEIGLLLDQVEGWQGRSVADPYYGDQSDFETTWTEVDAAARAFVRWWSVDASPN